VVSYAGGVTTTRSLLLALSIAVLTTGVCVAGVSSSARAEGKVTSVATAPVTVYGAKWCSACRSLERGLAERKIAFDVIDVDDNPGAFAKARAAANASSAIPLTGIARPSSTVWVVGADVDAVDRAQRGE
jgi:mycoredoxin